MKYTFSACWTDKLGTAIKKQCKESFPMDCAPSDAECVKAAVNQGIDSHLEACFIPEQGDSYAAKGSRLYCKVSPDSLPVLVRRLMESGNDEAESLAISICSALDIKLI
jgi:hypothetical protein